MEFSTPDYPGGFRNVVPTGERVFLEADLAIIAFGFTNKLIEGVQQDSQNRIVVNDQYLTSVTGVFAGGEAVTGPSTFMKAATTGMAAAEEILRFIDLK